AFGATQQVRRQVGSYRGNEDQHDAGDDAMPAQRNQNPPKRLPGGATQVRRSFKLGPVELVESRVERKNHERQFGVDQSGENCKVAVEQWQRLLNDSDRQK